MSNLYLLWRRFHTHQQRVITFLFLQVIFVIGIGLTAVVAKLSGKSFLNKKNSLSTWHRFQPDRRPNRLY